MFQNYTINQHRVGGARTEMAHPMLVPRGAGGNPHPKVDRGFGTPPHRLRPTGSWLGKLRYEVWGAMGRAPSASRPARRHPGTGRSGAPTRRPRRRRAHRPLRQRKRHKAEPRSEPKRRTPAANSRQTLYTAGAQQPRVLCIFSASVCLICAECCGDLSFPSGNIPKLSPESRADHEST